MILVSEIQITFLSFFLSFFLILLLFLFVEVPPLLRLLVPSPSMLWWLFEVVVVAVAVVELWGRGGD